MNTSSVAVFVYARFNSSRLPGKALLPFGASTLLGRVMGRASLVEAGNHVLLTSTERSDDALVEVAHQQGLSVVRGSLTNTVERTLQAITRTNCSHFVRVNGDSPFFDADLVNLTLQSAPQSPLTSNLFNRTFPYGVSVEVVDASYYRKHARFATSIEKEHVTHHLYRLGWVSGGLSVQQEADQSSFRLTVDTKSDYVTLTELAGRSHCEAPYWEILNLEEPRVSWEPLAPKSS